MTEEKILEELQPIFHDVFDDDEIVVTAQTSAKDIEDWDSLAQIRLVTAMEKFFSIKFTFDELQSFEARYGKCYVECFSQSRRKI